MKKLMASIVAAGLGAGLLAVGGCLDKADKVMCIVFPDRVVCDDKPGVNINWPDDFGDLF